jgi:hypothetical protein
MSRDCALSSDSDMREGESGGLSKFIGTPGHAGFAESV